MEEKKVKKAVYKKWWFWVIVAIIIGAIISPSDNDKDSDIKATVEPTQYVSPVSTYAEENCISEEKAKSIFDVCEKIGIEPKSLDENNAMAWEGYLIEFAFDGSEVVAAGSGTLVFYLKDADTAYKVSDILPTVEERSYTKTAAENAIKKILKAPKSAEFAGSFLDPFADWAFTKNNDGTITASSYVDSQNSFGAVIRAQFEITVILEGTNYTVTELVFDGEKII